MFIISNYSHKTKTEAMERIKRWFKAGQLSNNCTVFEVEVKKTWKPVEKIVLEESE